VFPVVFTIGTATVCHHRPTDGYGVATCNAFSQLLSLTLLQTATKATFAGNADYLGSSQQGTLLK